MIFFSGFFLRLYFETTFQWIKNYFTSSLSLIKTLNLAKKKKNILLSNLKVSNFQSLEMTLLHSISRKLQFQNLNFFFSKLKSKKATLRKVFEICLLLGLESSLTNFESNILIWVWDKSYLISAFFFFIVKIFCSW